jgi:hypothetical protein
MHKPSRLDRGARLKDTATITAELLMLPLTLFVFALAAISNELSAFIFERSALGRK